MPISICRALLRSITPTTQSEWLSTGLRQTCFPYNYWLTCKSSAEESGDLQIEVITIKLCGKVASSIDRGHPFSMVPSVYGTRLPEARETFCDANHTSWLQVFQYEYSTAGAGRKEPASSMLETFAIGRTLPKMGRFDVSVFVIDADGSKHITYEFVLWPERARCV